MTRGSDPTLQDDFLLTSLLLLLSFDQWMKEEITLKILPSPPLFPMSNLSPSRYICGFPWNILFLWEASQGKILTCDNLQKGPKCWSTAAS